MKYMLASMILAFGVAFAPAPATAQPLGLQQFQSMLENMGYETSERPNGRPGFVIRLDVGGAKIRVEAYHFETRVGLWATIGEISEDADTLSTLLRTNRQFTYAYLQLSDIGVLELVMPIDSDGLTPAVMRARIDEFQRNIATAVGVLDLSAKPLRVRP